jgi:hypothetical protein
MNVVESAIRFAIPTLGVGTRWLKEELYARGVNVRLTDACLKDLVTDARAAAARAQAVDSNSPASYLSCLRAQIRTRAELLRTWTLSDDRIDPEAPGAEQFVRLARKYALPRPWRLSEPVVSECPRRTPTYGYWASAT